MSEGTETKKHGLEGEVEVENGVKKAKMEDDDAGLLIVGGGTNWDLIGRKELPKGAKKPPSDVNVANLWGPHVWKENIRVKGVFSSCVACHSAIITEDGRVWTWGRNESGQLGHGDKVTKYKPEMVERLKDHNVVNVAMGRNHTLFLTDKGIVFSCGGDKLGQLGQGTEGGETAIPAKIDYSGRPIASIACGAEFSMIVDTEGKVFSFGSPEYGQLGHNTDGKVLAKANKITFLCETRPRMIAKFIQKEKQAVTPISNVCIKDIKCGVNHTVAVDDKGRVFTWGFGGYGRLGHSQPQDELIPRLVQVLQNFRCVITNIAAGSTFSLAYATNKNLYLWGQTKSSGEANMYPKPFPDLSGWNIRSMACANKSIIIAADDSVITCGPAPTYGELMYGEGREKSSTKAQEVKPLEDIFIKEVTAGFGHVLMIARDLSPEEQERIKKLPKWP